MRKIWKYLIRLYLKYTGDPYQMPKIFFHRVQPYNCHLDCIILNIHVDTSFTSLERQVIFDAVTDLEFFLNYRYIFNIKFDLTEETFHMFPSDHTIIKAEEDFPIIADFEKENNIYTIGLCQSYENNTNDIYLLHNRLNAYHINDCYNVWKVTVLHELGHLLKLQHTNGGIMQAKINGDILYPTYEDAVEFSRVHQCSPDDLQYFKG